MINSNKFKTVFYFAFSAIFGALIVFYILYLRFLRKNLPHNLPHNLAANEHYAIMIMYGIIWGIWCYIFLKMFLYFLAKKFNWGLHQKPNRWLNYLTKFYNDSVSNFYTIAVEYWSIFKPVYTKVLTPFLLFVLKYVNTRKRMHRLFFFLYIFPRTLLLVSFFTDIVIIHRFYFICIFSPILLLPLIERFLRFWIFKYHDSSKPFIATTLVFYYPHIGATFDVETYFEDELEREFDRSFAMNYKINFVFPIILKEFYLKLNLNYHYYCLKTMENYDPKKRFQILSHQLQFEFWPIIIFGQIYERFRDYLLKGFVFVQSFCYVLLWFYLICYSF